MRQIQPILAALKKHKAGAILLSLQVALTLAIVCNAMFIIQQRLSHMSRPTGLVESDLLTIQNRWVGVDAAATTPLINADLLALRQLPGVEDVTQTNSFPLRGGGRSSNIRVDVDAQSPIATTTLYFVDNHALSAMGARLIAGRNFRSDEIQAADPSAPLTSQQVIITKALADKVYPDGSALGKPVYIGTNTTSPSTVIGIVERLQAPWPGASADDFSEFSILMPIQRAGEYGAYLIRTKPGQLAAVTKSAPEALKNLNRMRVFSRDQAIRTFETVRRDAYRNDRGMAILMAAISSLLLIITASGIAGLTSFWVSQRRRQIGVRRALGATKWDILSYFLTENLLIGVAGVIVGSVLAMSLNLWMMSHFQMTRLSVIYVLGGVAALLALGQAAVFLLAFKASRVSPVEAIRG
ncbi:MAG: FtsX-like permease family protein [Luteibacter sp.]